LHNHDGVISILDNREGSIRPLGERGQKIAKVILSVDDILKEISSNGKEKRGEGIPLPNTSGTIKVFSSNAIKKNRGSGSGQQLLNPPQPLRGEAFSMKHFQNSGVLNQIKGFFKVQSQDYNLPFRVVTLVKKFKSPPKTVLNSSTFDETILIFMNNL
jgi:hypothetical protein